MRKTGLLYFALLAGHTAAADERSLAAAAERLTDDLRQTICNKLRADDAHCSITLESATQHQLGAREALWAFAWKAQTQYRLRTEPAEAMRDALEKKQNRVLDIFPDYFTGITYFRQQENRLEKLDGAAFSTAALTTRQKAVARIAPEFLHAGNLDYTLPEKWQNEGLSAADRGAITLTLPASPAKLAASLRNLDDAALSGVKIESCELLAGNDATDCSPREIGPLSSRSTIKLLLTAEKKLKASQPAFKLVLQDAENARFLLHLAIPYRPKPNYLVFAVAGFLFGGLIAVMVLLLRRRPVTHAKS